MAQIEAGFMGAPWLRHGEHVVALPTRKALALFAYLATDRGSRSRETLASLLWPEGGEVRARGSLRRALASLRAALGDDHLLSERDQLACSRDGPSAPLLDVHQLDAALAAARRTAADGAEPALQALFGALIGNQPQIDRLVGVIDNTVPVQEFFSPENISAIMAAAPAGAPA